MCGCGRRPNVESIVIPGENGQKWTFLAVEGTSHLPMDFIRTGENRDALEPVDMAKFWIAADMVTEGDFAAIMGRDVPEGRSPGQPVANIEWIDAYEYCRRFTEHYRNQILLGSIASIPTALEWAHAVSVLDGKVDLRSDVGTFLFTGSAYGGFLATKPCRLGKKNVNADLAVNLDVVGRHMKSHHAGLRLVLMPIEVRSNGPSPIVYRGGVLSEQGFFKEMKELLKFALERKVLTPDDEDRAKLRLGCAEDSHDFEGNEHEDWAGIVAKSAVFAEAKGYAVEPYATEWQMLEFQRPAENNAVVEAYRKVGVVGEWVRICDLPNVIREA